MTCPVHVRVQFVYRLINLFTGAGKGCVLADAEGPLQKVFDLRR